MARSGQGADAPPRAVAVEGGGTRPAPRPGVSGNDTKMAWGLVGLGLIAHMLRSPHFFARMALVAIALVSLKHIGQQNQASMTARLTAWNQREVQRLERKAKREVKRLERKAKRKIRRLEGKA